MKNMFFICLVFVLALTATAYAGNESGKNATRGQSSGMIQATDPPMDSEKPTPKDKREAMRKYKNMKDNEWAQKPNRYERLNVERDMPVKAWVMRQNIVGDVETVITGLTDCVCAVPIQPAAKRLPLVCNCKNANQKDHMDSLEKLEREKGKKEKNSQGAK